MTYIFIFNNASRAANYGIGTYVRQLSDGLSTLPDTTVAYIDMYAEAKEFTIIKDDSGSHHYQIPAPPSGMESGSYCRSIYYFLARNIESVTDSDAEQHPCNHEIVFQFNYFQHLPLATLLKGQFPDSRIILTVHYLAWCFELKGNVSKMRRITAKDYEPSDDTERGVAASFQNERTFMHLADEILVLSRVTLDMLSKDYGVAEDKLHLVYNGFGNELVTNRSKSERNILFVGRLDEIKGLKYLIDAFISIADKHPDANLIIAGDGEFQPYLAQCRSLSSRISFLGKMQPGEVEQIYQTAYIGVMPSFHEQCSYTAIEMMRHGIPVVGTDSTGLGEMLDYTPNLRVHINEEEFDEKEFTEKIAERINLLLDDEYEYAIARDAVIKLYGDRYKVSCMMQGIQTTVLDSFKRKNYVVSSDYLKYMDTYIVQLIMKQPDIDAGFFGLSGIGIYLWWRVTLLTENKDEEYQYTLLQEYLIYYLDWLYEVSKVEDLPVEMLTTLKSIETNGFYKTRVKDILSLQASRVAEKDNNKIYSNTDIIQNALRICNCKI